MLLLYAFCVGIVSSRKIERACHEEAAFRVLTGNLQPDHSRISEFRRRNFDALCSLFVQILRLWQKAGMVSLGQVALDGTKVKATSHERMLKAEAQLEKEIQELLRQAEILDAQEDGKDGKGNRGSDLPDELKRREDRLEKLRQARLELEAETAAVAARKRQQQAAEAEAAACAAPEEVPVKERMKLERTLRRTRQKAAAAVALAMEKAELAGVEAPDLAPLERDQMPRRGLAHRTNGMPKASTQRNFTDPESHIMKSNGEVLQGYNCQAVGDGDHQVIVAVGVSNQPPDPEHLEAMPERTIATSRVKHGQRPPAPKGRIPSSLDVKGRMTRKLRTKTGRAVYAKRKTIVEPVFGQTKEGRGLRRFLLRGLEQVHGEWTLWSTTHNLLKLFRFQTGQVAMATGWRAHQVVKSCQTPAIDEGRVAITS
jgi:hypothetical protein